MNATNLILMKFRSHFGSNLKPTNRTSQPVETAVIIMSPSKLGAKAEINNLNLRALEQNQSEGKKLVKQAMISAPIVIGELVSKLEALGVIVTDADGETNIRRKAAKCRSTQINPILSASETQIEVQGVEKETRQWRAGRFRSWKLHYGRAERRFDPKQMLDGILLVARMHYSRAP